MTGLMLKLLAEERIYVNGALNEIGDRRTVLRLPVPDTEVLRERDIIPVPSGADTLGTACVLAQMALMQSEGRDAILARLEAQFHTLLRDPSHRGNERVLEAARRLSEGSLFGAHYLLLRAVRERAATADSEGAIAPCERRVLPVT